MTEKKSNQEKDKEMFQAYAGVGVMFAFIIILFALTTPGVMGRDNSSNQEISDLEPTQIAQVLVEATDEMLETDIPVEATVEIATNEAVEIISTPDEIITETSNIYDPEIVALGETLYPACAACHGPDGTGITGLGKDIVHGEFVNSISDEELVEFIITGRPIWDEANTTMVDMPGRGGNPTLTDDDIVAIVAYLRTLSADETATTTDSGVENTDVSSVESVSSETEAITYDAESIANGETLFPACAACHGPDGTGITGLGKDLVAGEFSLTASDEELVNLIITGRPIWDSANTTMIDMPTRGGNPTLTDEGVRDIVAYIRSLQGP